MSGLQKISRRSVAGTGADPMVQFVPLEVDGVTFKLAYSFNAIAEAESITGTNLLQGIAAVLMNGMTAAQLRVLFAALGIAHPKITLEEAGRLVRIDTMPDIQLALVGAYDASLPEASKMLKDPTGAAGASDPGGD